MTLLKKPYFHDEGAAFQFVERLIWPEGPHCFHCGATDRITSVKANPDKRVRHGLHRCGHCKGQFTVRMGTIFEESKLPMTKWLQAIHLMVSSKKGLSALQLSQNLEISYKSAWFLAHRIREAMHSYEEGLDISLALASQAVKADETRIGFDPDHPIKESQQPRMPHKTVRSPVNRTGRVRRYAVDKVDTANAAEIPDGHLDREAHLTSD